LGGWRRGGHRWATQRVRGPPRPAVVFPSLQPRPGFLNTPAESIGHGVLPVGDELPGANQHTCCELVREVCGLASLGRTLSWCLLVRRATGCNLGLATVAKAHVWGVAKLVGGDRHRAPVTGCITALRRSGERALQDPGAERVRSHDAVRERVGPPTPDAREPSGRQVLMLDSLRGGAGDTGIARPTSTFTLTVGNVQKT